MTIEVTTGMSITIGLMLATVTAGVVVNVEPVRGSSAGVT